MSKRPREERRAKIAVIGAGGWAQGWHLPNLSARDDADIVAIVDPQELTNSIYNKDMLPLGALAQKYGGVATYSSVDALLADERVHVDGVLCSSNHATHYDIGVKVLEAGKHLMMEKPMTTDVEEARALYDAAQAHPELCFVLNNTANWAAGCVRAAELVAEGRVSTSAATNETSCQSPPLASALSLLPINSHN